MSQKVIPPSKQQVLEMAAEFGMTMSGDEAEVYANFLAPAARQYDRIDELHAPVPPIKYPRLPGYSPPANENPHKAWYWKTDIRGAQGGLLSGHRVAIKDNICVAGVPMMNGSRLLEGYVPDMDASVVTRVLDAGGVIAGKAACESLCLASQSYTCETGPILNPRNTAFSAGGSSGGNAALIASGEVKYSIGGDQGGSIRTPAAWCGIYGLKPSWGLVSTTGAMPISYAMDHLGPMCDTPESVARLLTVIAGQDENDPRTTISRPQDYLGALGRSMSGIRIGVLQEGFGLRNSDPRSDEVVRSAISHYESLGAIVTEISIPMHLDGASIHCGIVMEGAAQLIFHGNGQGDNWNGFYATSLVETFGSRWRSRPDELPYTAKAMLFLGHHMKKKYHGRYHAKAQNLKMVLRSAYDETFKDFDIIAMPTIPHVADRLPPAYSAMSEIIDASDMLQNTMPFDVTGHPAFSIPCGKVDGLPVGLMLVGRFMDDATVIAAGNAFYRTYDWQSGRRH